MPDAGVGRRRHRISRFEREADKSATGMVYSSRSVVLPPRRGSIAVTAPQLGCDAPSHPMCRQLAVACRPAVDHVRAGDMSPAMETPTAEGVLRFSGF
jgi:hypothetical protein